MIKPSHLILIIMLVMAPLFIVYLIDVNTTESQAVAKGDIGDILTEALHDAALNSSWEMDKPSDLIDYILRIEQYTADASGYDVNDETQLMLLRTKMPLMAFCGKDGCRFVYTVKDSLMGYIRVVSPVISYTGDYGNYHAELSFDGRITVTDLTSGKTYKGNCSDVYNLLSNPAKLSFMSNKDEYATEISNIAVRAITNEAEYLIHENRYGEDSGELYSFHIPEADTGKARTITGPCVMAFWQGGIVETASGTASAYGFSAFEAVGALRYRVLDDMYYHLPGSHCTGEVLFEGTLEDCARQGAKPCPHCFY